jgi:hypothetical protein
MLLSAYLNSGEKQIPSVSCKDVSLIFLINYIGNKELMGFSFFLKRQSITWLSKRKHSVELGWRI